MNDPTGDITAMVNALRQPAGIQLAGDVVPLPLPGTPPAGPTGPTPYSAPYATGKETDANIIPIPLDTLKAWMERTVQQRR